VLASSVTKQVAEPWLDVADAHSRALAPAHVHEHRVGITVRELKQRIAHVGDGGDGGDGGGSGSGSPLSTRQPVSPSAKLVWRRTAHHGSRDSNHVNSSSPLKVGTPRGVKGGSSALSNEVVVVLDDARTLREYGFGADAGVANILEFFDPEALLAGKIVVAEQVTRNVPRPMICAKPPTPNDLRETSHAQ
jgi:hypothetical protein